MTAVDFSTHAINPTAAGSASAAAAAAATSAASGESGVTFDDLIDIVNPLQHIPIVGTLYRAITGDHIKTFAKIAGDTLYGGIEGFASSVADTLFERITGKSVGDTVLGWVEDATGISGTDLAGLFSSHGAKVAGATPAPANASLLSPVVATPSALVARRPTQATTVAAATASPTAIVPASLATIAVPGQEALLRALSRGGVDQDIALRTADAYRRTLAAPSAPRGTVH